MARYTGPTTRISRRFGQHLLGSGKALERRGYPPGQHGPKLRRKLSEYAVGLNEKQKLRYIYGQHGQHGQHGPKLRRNLSEYAVGLNEKQKLRYIYGLLEILRRSFGPC